MTESELKHIITRYLKGQSTDKEKALIDALFESYSKQSAWLPMDEIEETEIESRLLGKVKSAIRKKEKQPSGTFKLLRLAAAVVILLVSGVAGYFYFYNSPQHEVKLLTKTTVRGQKSTIVIADGTNIKLNSESQLIYPVAFNANIREVTLTGEAFFDVARDEKKPFIIKSGDLVTQVLGTSFNISAFPEENITVTVTSGKVSVTARDPLKQTNQEGATQESVPLTHILIPGEQALFSPSANTIVKQRVNLEKYIAWKEGTIKFDETYLPEVIQTLERWFDVNIDLEMDELENCTVIGTYKDETLVNILESFKFINEIEYKILENNTILLSGTENWESCKN